MDNKEILETANSKEITLTYNGKAYPAKLYGNRLAYPIIATYPADKVDIKTEINWNQAEKLCKGEISNINY